MSGLETAIRNALDRAERGDGQVRARIYQSARQALDAGLRKQGVSDNLVIMQQRKRLEDKIREIEDEEIDRLAQSAAPPHQPVDYDVQPHSLDHVGAPSRAEPMVSVDAPVRSHPAAAAPEISVSVDPPASSAGASTMDRREMPVAAPEFGALGGVSRSHVGDGAANAPSMDVDALPPAYRDAAPEGGMPSPDAAPAADTNARGRAARGKSAKGKAARGMAGERAAKPRRRRGFLSHLITWMVTLAVVAIGCFAFYQSGMVQSIVQEAVQAANRPSALSTNGQGPSALSSRGGFSEEWTDIFEPVEGAAFRAGTQAQAQIATGSEGQALRIASASANAAGDVAIEVPADVLRELAGRSSTLAITVQSAADQPAQISVRCDFGSLGSCSRHRFTAMQERQDALFRVSFDRSMAPNAPGRLIINTGIGGTAAPVFVYSVRALAGQ